MIDVAKLEDKGNGPCVSLALSVDAGLESLYFILGRDTQDEFYHMCESTAVTIPGRPPNTEPCFPSC